MNTLLAPPPPLLRRYPGHVPAAPEVSATSVHPFANDATGLREVYDEHGSLVYRICRRQLDEHAAHDVTQEVFLSAWRARDRYDPGRGSVAAWLVGITKRRIIDHLRSERRHADRRAEDLGDDAGALESDVHSTIDRMIVVEALETLPERAREAIVLAYVHDLTHHEIADRTGVPLGTVKSDIRRGVQRIKDHLESTHA